MWTELKRLLLFVLQNSNRYQYGVIGKIIVSFYHTTMSFFSTLNNGCLIETGTASC